MRKKAKPIKTSKAAYTLTRGLTQSMLSGFIRCRKACSLSLSGWGSDRPRRALEFGSLFHALLQTWYGGEFDNPMVAFKHLAKKWEKTSLAKGDTIESIQQDLAMARALFPAYVKHHAKSDSKKSWIEVEQVFRVPFHGIDLRGKCDGLYQAKDKTLWLLETKTASDINENTMKLALPFDFQCLFYLLALELKLKRRISGVLYNVIRKPQIGRGTDRGSEAFVQKLDEDIASRPSFYFARFEVAFPDSVRKRFKQDLEFKIDDFSAWVRGEEPTYLNESACRGRWNCEYLNVCSAGGNPESAGFVQNKTLFQELTED